MTNHRLIDPAGYTQLRSTMFKTFALSGLYVFFFQISVQTQTRALF